MNTKTITDPTERKQAKRAARKEAPAKGKRPEGVDRGSMKKKVKTISKGQRKR